MPMESNSVYTSSNPCAALLLALVEPLPWSSADPRSIEGAGEQPGLVRRPES